MSTPPESRVIIIGGGIAGLSAGWYLQQEAARQNLKVQYTILEASDRWGGKVRSEQIDGFGDEPFILEAGADAFLTRKPWALVLAHELGLENDILGVNQGKGRTFVLSRGKLTPLPEGLQLLAPTRLIPFLRSPLFSLWGKLRLLLDWFIPPRLAETDETLADFVRRRLGAEALDKLGEPLLAGVYNAEPERQSILATFPQFPSLEKQYGSLIRGLRAGSRKRAADKRDVPPFISFNKGAQELIHALVTQLEGDLHLNMAVRKIEKTAEGAYSLLLDNGTQLHADAVILATPANISADLLREAAPECARQLRTIRFASIGTLYLGFRRGDVSHSLDGFGVVIPSSEGRCIDGMTWTSSKWKHRAPSDCVLLRVFFGGPQTRDMMALNDEALQAIILDEVQSLLGIQTLPIFHKIYRWQDAYPQYDLGHLERIALAEAHLPPGLYLTGSSYRGVGVPDCIKQGQAAGRQALATLPLTLRASL